MSERAVERWGESFDLAPKIGLMPLMRFAHVAKAGVGSSDMEGLDAMYVLLRQCFTAEAWARFEDRAVTEALDEDELLDVVKDALSAMTARPTGRPSDSSDGSPAMNVSSSGASSSPVIDRLVAKGRPDLALIVTRAQESGVSA